ncbi:MAG: ABC transporter substrate-binding protein [Actinobacteria bacterium]|nr:ABC transporter substrate-binding protein [Actinomycetota bacterium]
MTRNMLKASFVRWTFAAAVAVLVGSACTSSAPKGPSTVLRVMMTDDWVTAPYIDAVREFERRNPDVRVDTDKSPISKMPDFVRAGISSGAPPDVVQGHAHSGAGQGLAQPVDDLWTSHGLSPQEFLPGAVEDVTWGGRRYGLPLDSNAMVILYNAAHFRAAGLTPPGPTTSFADLERMAEALTTPDGSRRGLTVPIDNWVTYGWIRANGGELVTVEESGRPRFTFDDPAVVETIAFLDRLVERGLAFPPPGPDARSADAYALFRSGATSMYASGSWDLVKVGEEVANGEFGVALMPRGLTGNTSGTAMGGSSLWIPVGAKNRDLAFRFMMLLTTDPYSIRFAKEEGRLPVRPRLFGDPYFQTPQLKVFVEQLPTAHPPTLGALHDANQAFENALEQVLRGPASPAEALARAQATAVASVGPS